MSFTLYDMDGNPIRNRVVVDCSNDVPLTEQSHLEEVNINAIVKRHGIDLINKVAAMRTSEYMFDDVTGNDFQEAMNILVKAGDGFSQLPSAVRKQFDNDPAKFLDFVQDSNNQEQLVEMGLATRIPEQQPVEVTVTNPVTNTETPVE